MTKPYLMSGTGYQHFAQSFHEVASILSRNPHMTYRVTHRDYRPLSAGDYRELEKACVTAGASFRLVELPGNYQAIKDADMAIATLKGAILALGRLDFKDAAQTVEIALKDINTAKIAASVLDKDTP